VEMLMLRRWLYKIVDDKMRHCMSEDIPPR
jgi:hypothetical protein